LKIMSRGLTPLHDVGGAGQSWKRKRQLRSSRVLRHLLGRTTRLESERRTLVGVIVCKLGPQLVVWVTYDIEIQISNSHAFHVPFKYRYCDMQAH
jgi:hypothetical protein